MQLARRYLWASYDCMDYNGGVMLIHPALADPQSVIRGKRNLGGVLMMPSSAVCYTDILPEEIPLQKELERNLFRQDIRIGRSSLLRIIKTPPGFVCAANDPTAVRQRRINQHNAAVVIHAVVTHPQYRRAS